MAKEKIIAPPFDDIVFENRNKEYGAYRLRKKYKRNVIISMLIAVIIFSTAIIIPYLNAKAAESRARARAEREVEIKMENLDQPTEQVAPPPPPPPPPQEAVQQSRYVPPVVVDSVKPEEAAQLMTADQAQVEVRDEEVIEFVQEVKEEVKEEEPEAEPFVVVEEMPMFPGGDAALLQFIAEHTQYPEVAKENNIQGKVIVRFCVTSKGTVDRVSVLKGVDPELDKEAMRVVTTLPPFKPGKQGGIPVPVWYMVPINFTLK
ncbi:MAG: TonB family protein [Bacteroidales bacterium]|jgi:protein TonB|nr:TonB family protein [Bacteroidales bacterium]HPM19125.1 energy transducer TonB [Bacteroidales bacterium]HQG77477.1 energy transducer TonB [Bacteroidales bacterium]